MLILFASPIFLRNAKILNSKIFSNANILNIKIFSNAKISEFKKNQKFKDILEMLNFFRLAKKLPALVIFKQFKRNILLG